MAANWHWSSHANWCSTRQFVEKVRIEAARRLLEQTEDGIETVAARAGFANAGIRNPLRRPMHSRG